MYMKADGGVPKVSRERKIVIPRRERFQLTELAVFLRGSFTKFGQEEEIFGISGLCTSEKRSDPVFLAVVICSFILNGCVHFIEAREDGVMILVRQYMCILEFRRGGSSGSQKE